MGADVVVDSLHELPQTRSVRLRKKNLAPSSLPVQRLAGGEVDEVDPGAGRAGECLKAPPVQSLLFLQMSLHVQARVGALENDEIGHIQRLAGWKLDILDLDQDARFDLGLAARLAGAAFGSRHRLQEPAFAVC